MTLQLHDGLVLCDRYTLLHKLRATDSHSRPASGSGIWLAQDQQSGDRVAINILPERDNIDSASRQEAEKFFVHGLVHPNIVRTLAVDHHADGAQVLVVVTAYIPRAESFAAHLKDRSAALAILMPLLDALEYAHSLGLAHGNLSAETILVDGSGFPHLLSFGFCEHTPGWDATSSHLSPQVRSGARPQPIDDIYSLGTILFEIFTGNTWSGQLQVADVNSPMPESIQVLISSMLSDSSYDRPDTIPAIRARLANYLNPESDQNSGRIEATQFQKPGSSTTLTDAAHSNYVHAPTREKRTISTAAVISIFLVLIVLIGGVFFYLPSKVSRVTSPATNTPVTPGNVSATAEATTGPAPFELAQLEHFKEEARASAAKLLREQILLEDSGGLLWAKDKLESVQNLADTGDLLFRDKDFEGSIEKYQQSLSILEALKDSIAGVQSDYLARGHTALDSGDATTAIDAFTIVLSIAPDHSDAAKSLARAQRLEEVLTLLGTASHLEDEGQLQEALAIYKKARSIDRLWPAANEGVKRLTDKISRRNFNLAMSKGFSELRQNNFESARKAFSQAQKLLPDSQQPADGLHQVDLAFRLQKIEQHKKQADQFVQQENWSASITEYAAALTLDSTLTFAHKGLEKAHKRLQLSENLDKYIKDPLSLNDSDALKDAKQNLYQASLVSNPGEILSKQITALSGHIKLARVPIEIELQSDKLTDIVVYKVGHLGKLKSTRLELYPGVYTIVGKRKGYRDVRKQFTLLAGQNTAPVYVRCTEKI